MKNLSSSWHVIILFLVGFVAIFISCTPTFINPTAVTNHNLDPDIAEVTSITDSTTISSTPIPSSISIAATESPTSTTTTSTPVPPLPIEEEGVLLSELMSDNLGCELPCWWGITPGVTTEKITQEQFEQWGIYQWFPSDSYRLVNLGYPYPNSSSHIHDVSLKFWVDNGIVEYIYVSSQRPKQGVEENYYQDWKHYQVNEILNRFGPPTYIELNAGIPSASGKSYILSLSYPSEGLEIGYVIEAELLDNGQYQLCFDLPKFKFIVLNLFQPNQVEQVPERIIPNYLEEYTSLESVTGLHTMEFYEKYQIPNTSSCMVVE